MTVPGSPTRLRALIYNRVSADPSGRRISVGSQNAENRAFCERQDWEIVETIVDNDRSASRFAAKEREGYQQVRHALAGTRHGRIDVLVCWESSRAQRDLADYVSMRDLCVENHVLLAYKGRIYDLAEGDDRFATGIDALVDEREAERIRDRVMRGHRTSVSQGRPRGVVPYGYTRIYDPVGGHLLNQVPDPQTAPIVAEIVRMVLDGATLYKVAQDLNTRGVLTPRGTRDQRAGIESTRAGWSSSMIRNLLSKQSLMGVRTHNGKAVGEATWEPIVTPADWTAVQAVLKDPLRGRATPGRAVKYLLSGIAECGVCGAWLRPLTNRGRGTYVCAGRTPSDGKGHVARARGKLDEIVTWRVLERLQDPQLFADLAEPDQDGAGTAAAVQELVGLRAQLAQLEDDVLHERLSGAAFGRIEAKLLARIEDAQARSVPRSVPQVVRDAAGPDAAARWAAMDLAARRQIVRVLVRVRVHRVSRLGGHGFDASTIEVIDL